MLDYSSLNQAIKSLESVLSQPVNEFIRDAVIQRFEYTYELCWKMLSRRLEQDIGSSEVDRLSRKELFRVGFEKGFLEDPSRWFEYHTARNMTSHTYNQNVAEQVYSKVQQFHKDAVSLAANLQK